MAKMSHVQEASSDGCYAPCERGYDHVPCHAGPQERRSAGIVNKSRSSSGVVYRENRVAAVASAWERKVWLSHRSCHHADTE